MGERFQYARADGTPDWSVGNQDFNHVWDNARDLLRFHKGKGFRITNTLTGGTGPVRMLKDIDTFLHSQLDTNKDDVKVIVRSEADNYGVAFRKHLVDTDKGQLILAHAKAVIGTSYVFGVTDCSWLTMRCYGLEGIDLPHNAHLQHLDTQVVKITRAQIKPGDLLFHHDDDHVSLYLDAQEGEGRVIDTEPHDTQAPWGGMQGVGVQVRSMNAGYYCDFADINGYGRIVKINGPV